jgi:hypothetical protein
METKLLILILAAFNAYLLLSLSEDHFLEKLGNKILLVCNPCNAFWIAIMESPLFLLFGKEIDMFLAFPVAAITIVFLTFLKGDNQ